MSRFLGCRLIPVVGLFFVMLATWSAEGQTSRHDKARAEAEHRFLNAVASVVEKTNHSVIIEYKTSGKFMLPNPIQITPVSIHADTAQTITEMLASDGRFSVVADPDGTLMVIEHGLSQDVLNIRFKRITLSDEQRFNPDLAMNAVLEAPEIKAYLRTHDVGLPVDIGGFISPARPDLPHLPSMIENMTVLDAMKHIIAVFPHTGTYKESIDSRGRRVVAFGFVDAE
jgi:hypothetical protein